MDRQGRAPVYVQHVVQTLRAPWPEPHTPLRTVASGKKTIQTTGKTWIAGIS